MYDPEGWNTVTLIREEGFVRVWLNGVELYRMLVKAPAPNYMVIMLGGSTDSVVEVREVNVQEIPVDDEE